MKTCLIVDDSAVIRKVARRIFETMNFQVGEAEDGEKALLACGEAMPDAILLDWNMPIMSGMEFLKLLRGYVGGEKPKVVYCTVENDIGAIAMALKAGASDYMMKPFDRSILEAKFEWADAA